MTNVETMTTESEALRRLADDGYTLDLSVSEDARVAGGDQTLEADSLVVDRICRFEGISNPDDEAMILGVRTPDGRLARLALPYGPDVSGPQADAVRAMLVASSQPET